MCELLALSFNVPVKADFSFKGFQNRGEVNPDGWGIGWYENKVSKIEKEGESAFCSNHFCEISQQVVSNIIIAHVRRASVGDKTRENAHPFEFNNWVFAHNGTLKNLGILQLGRFKPNGETDSETAFCYLLNCLEKKRITRWSKDEFIWLLEIFQEINGHGKFNCIFSDGEYLFCFRDKVNDTGLNFVKREQPCGNIELRDKDWNIRLENKDPDRAGYIIATIPLTNEEWKSFNKSELIVFRKGLIIYSNFDRLLN